MTVFLLSHSTGIKGPGDFLEDYLLKRGDTVFKLEHPLDKYKERSSFFYKNKTLVRKFQRKDVSLLNYIMDYGISLKIMLFCKFDIFIGANNFDTLAGIIAKYTFGKKIKKILYFASDFSKKRFKSSLLNSIYFYTEKIAITKSNIVVSNTYRSQEARIKLGLDRKKSIVVSNGVFIDSPMFTRKTLKKDIFIYIGNVTEEHGLLRFLEVLHPLIKTLIVIGQGDQWEQLKEFCKNNNFFSELHYKKNHDFVITYLQGFNGFGLAPYTVYSEWTYYASPLKINEYISCGIPVITSDVTEISSLLRERSLGIVYHDLDTVEMKKKIENFDSTNYWQKAKKFYKEFNYNSIYSKIPVNP